MNVFFYFAALILTVADFWVWFIVGCVLFVAIYWLFRRQKQTSRRLPRIVLAALTGIIFVLAVLISASSLYQFWFTHRPLPTHTEQEIFAGVTYIRDVRAEPRPLVIHVVKIQLHTDGIHFFVTPGRPGQENPLIARTTSQFLSEFSLQIAINGDFFVPWWSDGIFNYYPHVGDPVSVNGFASSDGMPYSTGKGGPNQRTLYLGEDNQAGFNLPGEVYNAISGNYLFLEDGKPITFDNPYLTDPNPRTSAALNRSGDVLLLILVDGRQPGYSEGVSMKELADIVTEYGGYNALSLDGGGSTTLVMEGENGQPVVLNSPIDQRIPGRERPVANHLGIYAMRKTG